MSGIGLGGGGGAGSSSGGGGGGGPGNTGGPGSASGSGLGSAGSQGFYNANHKQIKTFYVTPESYLGQFNNMHGNGPHESAGSSSSNPSVSSRSSRIQQHQSQQQQAQPHFSSSTGNQIPLENGIDFRHSNSSHQNTSSSSIR